MNQSYFAERYQKLKSEGACAHCGGVKEDSNKAKCQKCRQYFSQKMTESNDRIRVETIQHYGAECRCCGETQMEFLTIDHMNGGGHQHAKETKIRLPNWLKKNNWPDGFQVLCYCCNHGKYIGGKDGCPHTWREKPSLELLGKRLEELKASRPKKERAKRNRKWGLSGQTATEWKKAKYEECQRLGLCYDCNGPKEEPINSRCLDCLRVMNENQAIYDKRQRYEAILAYGEKCICCSQDNLELLDIDHIGGGGCQHRKTIKRAGPSFFRWLRQQKYPAGYQIMCMNCNRARTNNNGTCPHKNTKSQA
jgi:hypothetical protein